jgi:hypothetical protein
VIEGGGKTVVGILGVVADFILKERMVRTFLHEVVEE